MRKPEKQEAAQSMAKGTPRPAIGLVVLVLAALAFVLPAVAGGAVDASPVAHARKLWDGAAAMGDIRRQLLFGSRAIGTPGHEKTIALIQAEFSRLGAHTTLQTWSEQTPDGPRRLTNVIERFDINNPRRIVLGTHYDSIIRAYADARDPNAIMPGANNSASGVALLLETARALRRARAAVGVDFIFFDGEEGPRALGAGDPNWRALGSPHFVNVLGTYYKNRPPAQAIIFDMVCYSAMKLSPGASSLASAPDEVRRFWSIGHKRAPLVFVNGSTPYEISDDQSALQSVHVPSFLVIGFEYAPYFNTTADTIDKCSAASLEAVGDTLMSYLLTL